MNTLMMVAQAGGDAGGLGGSNFLVMMVLMIGLFYFMMIRPQQRKEKERQRTISELRAGERIMFSGGLIGTVSEVRPHTFMVEVAHKVNIEIARGAVGQVLQKDEAPVVDGRK